jgi:anti-sigma factor RsiW
MFDSNALRRLTRPGIALLSLALLGLVVVPAVGAASTPATTAGLVAPATAPGPSGIAARRIARHPLLAGTVRAELTVVKRDGTTVLVHYEAGVIASVNATSVTIRGRDGKGATFAITAATRVRAGGRPISIAELKVGDRAMVFGTDVGGSYTAIRIRCVRATDPSAG